MTSDAMDISYRRIDSSEGELLADWLASEAWPFHGRPEPDREKVLTSFRAGFYDGEQARTFWILLGGSERVGLIRLFDLLDPIPRFDIRLRASHRGKGIGKEALRWLTDHVFETMPEKFRIEGETRLDNIAMRRVFRGCGYVKEAHYRKAWPAPDGRYHDAVGYGITRDDWADKTVTPVDWDDEP